MSGLSNRHEQITHIFSMVTGVRNAYSSRHVELERHLAGSHLKRLQHAKGTSEHVSRSLLGAHLQKRLASRLSYQGRDGSGTSNLLGLPRPAGFLAHHLELVEKHGLSYTPKAGNEYMPLGAACRKLCDDAGEMGQARCRDRSALEVTRMMADLYLDSIGAEPFRWGGANLDIDGSSRAAYIAALIKAANADEYEDLIRFARGD